MNTNNNLTKNTVVMKNKKILVILNIFRNIFTYLSKISLNYWSFLNINVLFYYDYFNFRTYNYSNLNLKKIEYLFIYPWVKVTFRGKGFRIRKTLHSTKITFSFGRSHWTKLWLKNFYGFTRKIRRQNYIITSFHIFSINKLKKTIKFIKYINHYTKRGLRLKKQLITKRFGKISQMISSLHF